MENGRENNYIKFPNIVVNLVGRVDNYFSLWSLDTIFFIKKLSSLKNTYFIFLLSTTQTFLFRSDKHKNTTQISNKQRFKAAWAVLGT